MKKSSSIRVSFILPSMNRPQYVERALSNAMDYVEPLDEFIVVDGSKNTETKKVVQRFKKKIKNLVYIQSDDRNEAHATNAGLLQAKGVIIKPISDDDLMYPAALKKALKIFELHSELDAVQCGGEAFKINPETNELTFMFYEKIPEKVFISEDFSNLLNYAPCQLGLIFRKRCISLLGIFDTSFTATDINIMARMILLKLNFKYLDLNIYQHIQYPHSTETLAHKIMLDWARIFMYSYSFPKTLNVETRFLAKAFGLSESAADLGFVWLIKVANIMRNIGLFRFLFGLFGRGAETFRNLFFHLHGAPYQDVKVRGKVKWTGKLW